MVSRDLLPKLILQKQKLYSQQQTKKRKMKKLLAAVLIALSLNATAQTTINLNQLDSTATVATPKVDSSLYTMTKMQLTEVYLDEVTKLAFSTPYVPFTMGTNDTIHGELDIPVSRYTARKRETIEEQSKQYGEIMKEKLYELVPYSDKKDIIRAIIYLREVNANFNSAK